MFNVPLHGESGWIYDSAWEHWVYAEYNAETNTFLSEDGEVIPVVDEEGFERVVDLAEAIPHGY